ncbi:MAG: RpoL/Rpb11 RNA polymerase subunit family protein [Candidatus Micrarchaeota archaeon]|nr:RpoL/Rpb11 RNA polymerase subunit family protein [Candidatus Micrarchaeota archaeon]
MKILESDKNHLKLHLIGSDIGVAQALAEKLLENKEITFASALYDHPTKRNPVLTVTGKNPKKEVLAAAKALSEEAKAFEEALRKA